MDLHQLRTFVAIAQEGHLTRAAERLHISQPTASAHIRTLEETLQVTLFARRSSGVEITRAGELLLRKAEAMLDSAMEFRSLARALSDQVSGAVVVGSNADPGISRVGPLAGLVSRCHPLIDLSIELRATAGILRGIRGGELDCGFFLGHQPEKGLACRHLVALTYRVAGPVAWHDAIQAADLRALAHMPWILAPEGNAQADMLAALFHGSGLMPIRAAQANNDLVIRSMIAEGVGLSLVRADHADEGERAGTMSISPIAVAGSNLLFAYRQARAEEPVIQAVLAAVDKIWGPAPV